MIVFETINDLTTWLDSCKKSGQTLGFAPTMGALHKGHISLINRAKEDNSVVLSSIFVNPTQFNNAEDLKKYPKTIEKDLEMLREAGCDAVFLPSVTEMYPDPDAPKGHWHFGLLSDTLEGHFRPGHFDGVLTIVKKFFDIIQPNSAYFGEKDYQQLAHIRQLVITENMPIRIVSCPTLREDDGLAMSSRNLRLTADQRQTALVIYNVLKGIKEQVPQEDPPSLEIWGRSIFLQHPEIELEYLEIIDGHTFSPLADWSDSEEPVALIAAYVGDVRLIDNMRLA